MRHCLWLLLIISTAKAQHTEFGRISVEQGLSFSHVSSIFQDSKGFMWFGTGRGLDKYDGYSFTVYRHDPQDSNSISNNAVWAICEDRSGVLWMIAAGSELNRFDRVTEKFSTPFPEAKVTGIFEDKSGTLWFATHGQGLLRFDTGNHNLRRYTHSRLDPGSISNDTVLTFCEDRTGMLWVGSSRQLNSLDKSSGSFTHYDNGPVGKVYSIYEDSEFHGDNLWIGTSTGIYRYDLALKSFRHYENHGDNSGGVNANDVRTVYEDREGVLWIGTQAGLAQFDRSTGSFTNYESEDPEWSETQPVGIILEDRQGTLWSIGPDNLIGEVDKVNKKILYLRDPAYPMVGIQGHSMYEDRAGTVWFGTTALGVIKFDPAQKAFHNYGSVPFDKRTLNSRSVGGILEDRSGVLWVATPIGLNKFNPAKDGTGGSFTHYTHDSKNPQSLSHPTIWPILEDREGSLWLGTVGGGLDVFDRAKKVFVHHKHDPANSQSLAQDEVLSLFEDKSGTLWIGLGDEGLDEFDRASGTFIHHKPDPNDSNSINNGSVGAIFEDRLGALWVGTIGGGLNKFDRMQATFKHYTHDSRNLKSLSHHSVRSLLEDREGNLWIGTSAGLNRFDRKSESFTVLAEKDGLASDQICGILEDDRGCIWLNTGKGVSRFDPRTRTVRNYDEGDGVRKSQAYAPSGFKNSKGEMFFGGITGFVRFHPDSIRDNPYVPPVVITAFRKFDKIVQLDSAIAEKKEISLVYSENMFSFEFAALNYTNSEKNQYAYMLEGFDKDWIHSGTRRYATYTNLDPGKYTFKVNGSNNDGVWNASGASIQVIIIPPFWATWWFRTAFFVAVLLSAGGAIRYIEMRRLKRTIERLTQERALERERSRISQDMHDEVGASLTEIAILSELAQKEMEDKSDTAGSHIRKIADRSREVVDSMSEIIWTINPKNDHLNDLLAYLHQYAMLFLKSTAIRCRFESPETTPDFTLSAEVRRHIFLVVKEALHNVVKHSHATETIVRCGFGEGMIEVSVKDNGRGFALEQISRFGNGVLSMRKRIEDIGGTFTIDSHQGGGTKVCISVPIAVSKA